MITVYSAWMSHEGRQMFEGGELYLLGGKMTCIHDLALQSHAGIGVLLHVS